MRVAKAVSRATAFFRKDPSKFAEDDPLRYLHVERGERLTNDSGGVTYADDEIDLSELRRHPGPDVVIGPDGERI